MSDLRRSKSVLFVGYAFQAILRLAQAAAIARIAGPHAMGVFYALMAIPQFLFRLLDFGFPHAFRWAVRSHLATTTQCVRVLLWLCVVAVPLAVGLVWVGSYFPFESAETASHFADARPLLIFVMLVQLMATGLYPMIAATEDYFRYSLCLVLPPFCFLLLTGLALCGDLPFTPNVLLLLSVASDSIAVGVALVLIRPSVKDGQMPAKGWQELRAYAFKTYPGTVVKGMAQRVDRVLLAALLPPSAYSYYVVASSLRDQCLSPLTAYSPAFFNKYSRVGSSLQRIKGHYLREVLAWTGGYACVAIGFLVFGQAVLAIIYGPVFTAGASVLKILMWSLPFAALVSLTWEFFMATRHPAYASQGMVFHSVTSVGLLYFLTTLYGIDGTGAAVVIATASTCVLSIWRLQTAKHFYG